MKIKNHEILHEISRGALTTVYKARHLNLDRPVLLKVLNPQWLNQQDLLERFRREAQISGRLKHPNIVNVYDFEISADLVYISMEYVEGETLSAYIEKHEKISFNTIQSIFKDVLAALHYAHQNGVIHRDIKPSNILLDDALNARLTDFGLASLQDIPALTEQGQSMGTPAYMAPEQIQGEKCDERTDLYSLGISLYEMTCGYVPFQKENTAATLQSALSDPLPPITATRQDIPQDFRAIIESLTQKDKQKRPRNAAQLQKIVQPATEAAQSEKPVKHRKIKKPVIAVSFAIVMLFIIILFIPTDKGDEITADMPGPSADSIAVQQTRMAADTLTAEPLQSGTVNDTIIAKNNPAMQKKSIDFKQEDHTAVPVSAPQPVAAEGRLFIVCNPWAVVKINGDSVDTTPLKKHLTLSGGRHQLQLFNPNFKQVSRSVEIRPGKTDTLSFQLEPAFGYLMVRVTPWAKLFINDQYKEDTPIQKPLLVHAGKNIITVSNPALGTITDTIFVEAGKTVEKHFTFVNK